MRRSLPATIIILLGIALLGMTACTPGGPPDTDDTGEAAEATEAADAEAPDTQAPAAGTWGEEGEGLPQLVLEEDGTLHGTDGCNRLVGEWEQDEAEVTFGPLAATRMFCEGVDDWASRSARATVDEDLLVIYDAADEEIGTLTRQ